MKRTVFAAILLLAPVACIAQTPASTPANAPAAAAPAAAELPIYKGEIGYSYTYPTDWEVVDTKPMMPAVHQQAADKATSDPEKKGAECAQIGFMVRHGNPASVIMSLVLPFECYGSKFSQDDLPALGEGIATGMKQNFDTTDTNYDAYKIGTHRMWIERAKGNVKGHPESAYTLETVCGVLDKGMVCMFTLASNEDALKVFEQGAVSLEGDAVPTLVPSTVFAAPKK